MRLFITRHGTTKDNKKRIIQGHTPGELTDEGKLQADLLGMRLSSEHIDMIYSSDLKRAHETAMIIADHVPDARLETDERLRERDFGHATGTKIPTSGWDDFEKKYAGHMETMEEVRIRLESFFSEIISLHPDDTVLVVSHGLSMVIFIGFLQGKSIDESFGMRLKNTSLTEFYICPDGNVVRLLNCINHLD